MKKRQVLAWLAAAAALGPAAAQDSARSFAVVSEIAHQVSVVTFQESTGTRLGNNVAQRIPIPDGLLDKVALVKTREELDRRYAGAPVWLVSPLDTDLFDALGNYLAGAKLKFADDVAAEFQRRGTTHLVLLTRFRGDASLQAKNAKLGDGKLEGLGFYLDRLSIISRSDTGEQGQGFLAPFVYFRVTLVDARSAQVLGSKIVTEGRVLSAARAKTGTHPWDVMTPQEKVKTLSDMLTGQIERVLPELLAGI